MPPADLQVCKKCRGGRRRQQGDYIVKCGLENEKDARATTNLNFHDVVKLW